MLACSEKASTKDCATPACLASLDRRGLGEKRPASCRYENSASGAPVAAIVIEHFERQEREFGSTHRADLNVGDNKAMLRAPRWRRGDAEGDRGDHHHGPN